MTENYTRDFSLPVYELHELFQTPEAALAAPKETSGQVVVVHFQFLLHVVKYGPVKN